MPWLVEKVSGDVIIVAVDRAAVFGARMQCLVAPAIHRDQAAGGEQPTLGLDVDDARGAEAVLRRQGAGDQVEGVGEARAQALAEKAQPRGEADPVDPELRRLHLVADMNAAGGFSVLAHTRCLQDDLVERVVGTAGLGLDRLSGHRVGRGAELRLDCDAGRLEPLRHDAHFLEFDRCGAGRWRCRIVSRGWCRRTERGVLDRADRWGGHCRGRATQHHSEAEERDDAPRHRPTAAGGHLTAVEDGNASPHKEQSFAVRSCPSIGLIFYRISTDRRHVSDPHPLEHRRQ